MCALISDDNAGNERSKSKYSKQISSYVRNRAYFYHREKVAIDRVDAIHKQSGVFQNGFSDHYATHAGLLQTTRHVGKRADSAVGKHGDGKRFADLLDGLPVACAHLFFVLLARTTMDLRGDG